MGNLETFRDDLLTNVDRNMSLIQNMNSIIYESSLPASQKVDVTNLIVEWSFVRVQVIWENFLEDCFLKYMLGELTASGFGPKRYVSPIDKQHALRIVLAGKEYFQWNEPSKVKEQAQLYFQDGDPFIRIDLVMEDLKEMITLRNAIVHRSSIAMEKFKTLAREKISTFPPGLTPGGFLVMNKEPSQRTFLNYYFNKLKVAAKQLVPS